MSIMRLVWPSVLFMLALTACSELQSLGNTGNAPVISRGFGVEYWLSELHDTREMTPDEVQQTVQAWEQELIDDPSTGNHIKLALLLTAGDASARDPKRARELLNSLDPAQENTCDRELVTILRQILDEQDQANQTISKLNKQVRSQSLHINELEEQQRALTDIEQNIQQRDIQPGIENGEQ